jgi:hypothetical protein
MKNKHIEFPSIEQFRNVVKELTQAEFVGVDENGEKIYDRTKPKPVIKFTGTVKLHGTNAGVAWGANGMYVQSRSNIITPENDNAGFAAFVESKKTNFSKLFFDIKQNHEVPENKTIVIYGEWCGANIQKGVAIANLPKSFFIFGICLVDTDGESLNREWIDITPYRDVDNSIYNIMDYSHWTMEIDFNNPGLVQNELIDLTLKVEEECPVAKAFGFSGVGEGIVWEAIHNGKRYVFKVKGEKHSVSKVKTLANVDVEKLASINDFCDYAVTENRLNQAIENVFGSEPLDIKKMGDVIRFMVNDIAKEESDTLVVNFNLTAKDVNKYLSDRTRIMFGERLNKQSGLA